jgi:hypothetical protein
VASSFEAFGHLVTLTWELVVEAWVVRAYRFFLLKIHPERGKTRQSYPDFGN